MDRIRYWEDRTREGVSVLDRGLIAGKSISPAEPYEAFVVAETSKTCSKLNRCSAKNSDDGAGEPRKA